MRGRVGALAAHGARVKRPCRASAPPPIARLLVASPSAHRQPPQPLGGGKRRPGDRKTALVELERVRGHTTSPLAAQTHAARSRLAPYETEPRTAQNAV